MTDFTVAFIGTGPEPDNPEWGKSSAMAYRHAHAFDSITNCELVACADIVEENALAFADTFDINPSAVFTDYREMVTTVQPDIVSICTPVPTHAEIVIDCAQSQSVRAIHCEKPMAGTWADSKEMARVCENHGVNLTFNHQRRSAEPSIRVREIIEAGKIGDVGRVELATKNWFDAGTHLLDLCAYFTGDADGQWVLGQIDYRNENVRYGVHNENQALMQWQYENGVYGLAFTGGGSAILDCEIRVTGTDGVIELNPPGDADIRIRTDDSAGWKDINTGDTFADIPKAAADVVHWLETGEPSNLRAENALRTTEIIFGGYESVRRRGRVDLPLEITDNPLEDLVETGELKPAHSR